MTIELFTQNWHWLMRMCQQNFGTHERMMEFFSSFIVICPPTKFFGVKQQYRRSYHVVSFLLLSYFTTKCRMHNFIPVSQYKKKTETKKKKTKVIIIIVIVQQKGNEIEISHTKKSFT